MRLLASIVCLIPTFAAAQAEAEPLVIPDDPASVRRLVIPGKENAKRTGRLLSELNWMKSLPAAAKSARKLDRPIVFIQALGDLRGSC